MLHLSEGATPDAVATACGATLLHSGTKRITGAVIDSRVVKTGDLFVAIPGERTDGHRHLTKAVEAGAAAVLIQNRNIDTSAVISAGASLLLTDNTTIALGRLAACHKATCPALTVAVTGSVGKTTTRQFIYSVLAKRFSTHKTEGNYNNELGLPLTLLTLSPTHNASVLELGMSRKGEISYLTDLVRPDIAVVTNIGTAHIEYLGSREAIRDAKMEIAEGLKPGGCLLLNGDEPLLQQIPGATYVALENSKAAFRAANIRYMPEGMYFDAVGPSFTITDCQIPTLGDHTVLDAMFAVAVGTIAGLTAEEIRAGLRMFEGVGMRQNIRKHQEKTFVLDYYNASPESIRASLVVTKKLAEGCCGRTIAVIGSVLELGHHAETLHRAIGAFVATLPIDQLFTFGADADFVADEAQKNGMSPSAIHRFSDSSDAKPITEALRTILTPNDCILLKASHSIHLERIADALLNENT